MTESKLTFGEEAPGVPRTGSTLLRAAMAEAVERFPQVFGDLRIADGKAFKAELPSLIVRFEARRAASPQRVEVARFLADYVPSRATMGGRPLADALREPRTVERTEVRGTAPVGWTPTIETRGRTWRGAEIGPLADELRAGHRLTGAAAAALRWMCAERLSAPVDLSGERFVILGAGAELAPTLYLLQAGARVLWVDPKAPDLDPATFAGVLVHAPAASDLLGDPAAVYAAIAAEAAAGPVHLGLYAYAPGGGRELLLTTVMNAIVAALPEGAVRSVAMLVSPTTPGELQPDDREARERRRAGAPRWQRALARARVLAEPAHERHGDVEISRSIVPLQGPTYLAAQYLGKMVVAEAWAVDRAPMRVSANVAGITHTRSLEHPLFLAGFLGARHFGIEVFLPDATRVLSTLLVLHDLLNPAAPGADPAGGEAAQARRVVAQAVHGGVRSAPFVFDHTIRVAAVLGLARNPSLLLQLRS
jgi:hypothetical protein